MTDLSQNLFDLGNFWLWESFDFPAKLGCQGGLKLGCQGGLKLGCQGGLKSNIDKKYKTVDWTG